MAKKTWVIGTDEGGDIARQQGVPGDVGSEVELELSYHQEKAMVAAGWVEEPAAETSKQQKKKED
jgi:hypothetical protein